MSIKSGYFSISPQRTSSLKTLHTCYVSAILRYKVIYLILSLENHKCEEKGNYRRLLGLLKLSLKDNCKCHLLHGAFPGPSTMLITARLTFLSLDCCSSWSIASRFKISCGVIRLPPPEWTQLKGRGSGVISDSSPNHAHFWLPETTDVLHTLVKSFLWISEKHI